MSEVSKNRFRVEQDPQEDDTDFQWTMVRARFSRPPRLICLSHTWFGIRTHYLFNRTTPCQIEDCPGCMKGMDSRWHGYLLTVEDHTKRHMVYEFTAQVRLQFKRIAEESGTLRGFQFTAGRLTDKPNAKVVLAPKGFQASPKHLPPDDPIWPIIAHIFGLTAEAPVKVQATPPPTFEDYKAAKEAAEEHGSRPENEWIQSRVADIAGQLVLPLSTSRNGQ